MRRNKTFFLSFMICLFMIVSFIILVPYVHSDKPQNRATNLLQRVTKDGETERIDYIDENGTITMAADLGYATIIKTVNESCREEHFYDENGNPVSRYPGYYALRKEYDEENRNYHITYLDQNNIPLMTKEGYSDKYLTFYDTGKIKTEKYFDTVGNPVCTSTYGYGFLNEYNENGRKYKTIYLDKEDHPLVVGLGYAIVCRCFYESEGPYKGKVESEFYFDENEKPMALSLGQYGVHKEYNDDGQETVLTYLDAEGKAIVTKKGYTTVIKTFHTNNAVASEQYYDINGEPYALVEGQFGIKKEDGQEVYLDQEGKETFNLKKALYNHSWVIVPTAMVLISFSIMLNRKSNIILTILYVLAIIYLTLMFREDVRETNNWVFRQYVELFINNEARIEITRNIWLFIPLGAILYRLYSNKVILLFPFALSFAIEVIQLISHTGYGTLDDLISNCLGSMVGFSVAKLLYRLGDSNRKKQ